MPIRNSTHRKVVGTYFDLDAVAWQNSNVVHSHLSTHVGQYFEVAFIQLDAKTSVGQILKDRSIEFNALLLS